MEIDVTQYVTEIDCEQFSSSIAESGLQNIGEITWNNALRHVAVKGLVTPEQQTDLRDWIREFGAWDDAEIAAMSDQETNALLLQFVASAIRELEASDCTDESPCGRLYRLESPGEAPTWRFYMGV